VTIRRCVPFRAVLALILAAGTWACSPTYDLVIIGGRVIDPETELDAVMNVGVRNGMIVAVGESSIAGRDTLDATGFVVAPGFVDLHAHGQDSVSNRLQALDGVTTALEMEVGVYPVAAWLASRESRALLNYGATVSHPGARAKLLSATMVRTSGEAADASRTVAAPIECDQNPIRSGANPRLFR